MPSDSSEISPLAFGKYLLLARIGKGGMAEVFLSRPFTQRRLLAIKVIRSELAQNKVYVDMFVREGTLAIKLNHDAIVKTFEIGKVQGRHFICMEHISGVDLSQLLARCRQDSGRRLSVPHALHIAQRICEGLHFAHELRDNDGTCMNVVNRDVSPSNIRLSFQGEVKLLDFGIAKAVFGLSTEIGVVKGKYAYMSPEQVRGLPLDRRSDIFTAGVILWEMLALDKLFRGDSDFHVMDLVRRAEFRPPSAFNSRVPAIVDDIVHTALQKEPAARFQTAEEMAGELRSALAKYNFQRSELRDLVRDTFGKEWSTEQKTIQLLLSQDGNDVSARFSSLGGGEDYGEFPEAGEIEILPGETEASGTSAETPTPTWIWTLLGVAIVLVLLAAVLVILL